MTMLKQYRAPHSCATLTHDNNHPLAQPFFDPPTAEGKGRSTPFTQVFQCQ